MAKRNEAPSAATIGIVTAAGLGLTYLAYRYLRSRQQATTTIASSSFNPQLNDGEISRQQPTTIVPPDFDPQVYGGGLAPNLQDANPRSPDDYRYLSGPSGAPAWAKRETANTPARRVPASRNKTVTRASGALAARERSAVAATIEARSSLLRDQQAVDRIASILGVTPERLPSILATW